jgi:hypothetical protein
MLPPGVVLEALSKTLHHGHLIKPVVLLHIGRASYIGTVSGQFFGHNRSKFLVVPSPTMLHVGARFFLFDLRYTL